MYDIMYKKGGIKMKKMDNRSKGEHLFILFLMFAALLGALVSWDVADNPVRHLNVAVKMHI